ncbi:glutamate--cysteine ligase EgtA [Thermopolyspora flexuosa]|uniref:Glutamate--cysteine ligase EgtA n=1 Tax=Thermopolyspora flexuosa TaxID=103836 RepID=A0A543IYK0_9ACTN|nr:ergothioneine biosynthesis glutamate--cysteine ligase EgtA [Thermopolyspora flexuosa]TQM75643.1 glutamate--cysteine ligase [Thermopolyspora flexuosa]GGM60871.1 glutamate--cysteine ligase EgtA [Thermopolyspora flexuosa]
MTPMTQPVTDAGVVRDAADVAEFARACLSPAGGDRVGIELEFLVFDRADLRRHVPIARIRAALADRLPGGSRVSFEPGGQLELSSPPAALPDAIACMGADVAAAAEALERRGLVLAGVGIDPVRPPLRQLRLPRYEAMAAYFAACSPGSAAGRLMMCSTASVQVNVDLGPRPEARWARAHALGPVLAAAFANSPLRLGRPCGWMSARQRVWARLDRTRTAPVPGTADGTGAPARDWARYLLDARLMVARDADGRLSPVRDGTTFRDRLAAPGPPPTAADLAYHATTLFPPVRPRGWLEIRYLDAQGPEDWPVAVAVPYALVVDDRAGAAAMAAVADAGLAAAGPYGGPGDPWRIAARCGLADPALRRAADACFRAALGALPRLGAPAGLVARVAAFADRHVAAGRSPAAGLLATGPLPAPLTRRPAGATGSRSGGNR